MFTDSFAQPPKIFLAIRLIDALNRKGADFRFAVEPRFITDSSFTVTASTWNDSRVWSLQVTWIAIDTRFSNQFGSFLCLQNPHFMSLPDPLCLPSFVLLFASFTLFSGSMIQVGFEKFHNTDHGFTLNIGSGERSISRRLAFESKFGGSPQVFTGFSMIDAMNGEGYDLRIESLSNDVDEYGFDVGAKTCANGKLWSVQVSWIAIDPRLLRGIPQEEVSIYGSRVKTGVHIQGYSLHRGDGARHIDRHIPFEPPFAAPPQVATFLSSFNILMSPDRNEDDDEDDEEESDEEVAAPKPAGGQYKGVDARIVASDEHRSQYGFDLRLGTWNDSRVWDASAAWIAIGTQRQARIEEEEEDEEEIGFFDDEDDEEEEEQEEEEEEEDFLPPRANPVPKRQISIPIIIPDGEGDDEAERRKAAPPATKKAKLEEEKEEAKISSVPPPTVPSAAAPTAPAAPIAPATKKQPSTIDQDKECKVCMDAVINTVLIPCGHVALCFDCATTIRAKGHKECPICRKNVESIVKTYRG